MMNAILRVMMPTRSWIPVFFAALLVYGLPATVWAGSESGTPGLLFAPSAEVDGFSALSKENAGPAMVRWSTSGEFGVQAFRLSRVNADGSADDLGLVRARGFDEGDSYELADPAVQVGNPVKYELFMISHYGEQKVFGWEGVVGSEPLEALEPVAMADAVQSPSVPVSAQKYWIGNGDRVRNWTDGAPADRIRFSLTEEGAYKVTAQEMADAGGWDFDSVTNALSTTNFAMSCQGEDVAWLPDGDGLIFHGLPAESRWAPENVYWIEFGSGLNMQMADGTPPVSGTTNSAFTDRLLVRGTSDTGFLTYCTLPDSTPTVLAHSRLLSGDSKQAVQELTDCAPGEWMGEVTVNLHSWFLFENGTIDTHTGQVSVGTAVLGEPTWTGEQYVSFSYPFASSNLTAGTATLTLNNIAPDPFPPITDYTRFFWMSYGFSYSRLYQAYESTLRCTGGAGDTVTVPGFATNDLVVLDVSTTNLPVLVDSIDVVYDGIASNWAAAFACGDTSTVYQVCSKTDGLRLPSVRGVRDVDWTADSNAVDYAILIPPEGWMEGFRAPLQQLADHRSAQGLITEVVDVESLYNRFSHGLVDAAAIEAFCLAGVSNWTSRPLQYLLLGADGSLDFKHDKFTAGDSQGWFIPTRFAGQSFSGGEGMITALDMSLGDVDGDHIPEVAIGRLPTGLTQEVAVVVQKTLDYEAALLRTNGTLAKAYAAIAPDWNNTPGTPQYYDFDLACDRLIPLLEDADRVHVPCRAPTNDPNNLVYVKTNILFPALQEGCGIFYYFGHGNKTRIGYSSTLLYAYGDIDPANWESPVIMMILSCSGNVWHWLSGSRTLMPYGLFAEGTGFAASLGAAGFLFGDESEELAVYMFGKAAQDGLLRLGDVHLAGIRESIENPLDPNRLPLPERDQFIERIQCISLIGDPALIWRHDVTAQGTDVEWLVDHGQTAANADLEDPDLDGWATWQEYPDGTSPTSNVLQLNGTGFDSSGAYPTLAFETASNALYQIEYKPSLMSSNDWQAVSWSWTNTVDWQSSETDIVPDGPVSAVIVPDSLVTTQGFFRVKKN